IACPVDTAPCLAFYKALKEGLDELGLEELFATYRFFALPFSSYHVTAFDGLNQGNLDNEERYLSQNRQFDLEDFLSLLPVALRQSNPFTPEVEACSLVRTNWDITFEFEKLTNWSGNALVARLKIPDGDQASTNALTGVKEARTELAKHFKDRFYPPPT